MKKHKLKKLPLGLYRVHWKSGGTSIASIYQNGAGNKYIAPTNWASSARVHSGIRKDIKRMELITKR